VKHHVLFASIITLPEEDGVSVKQKDNFIPEAVMVLREQLLLTQKSLLAEGQVVLVDFTHLFQENLSQTKIKATLSSPPGREVKNEHNG